MTKHIVRILIILLFFTSCDFKTAGDYYNLAITLSEQGKSKEAIEMLNKAIEKDSKFINSYINRGAYKSDLGFYEEAIKDYKEVLILDSTNMTALLNIGRNYTRLEKYDSSLKFLNKAIELKGGGPIYFSFSQNFMNNSENYDVPFYEICYERGIAYYNLDSLKSSYYDFMSAINNNFMTADCYLRIGYIYLSTGNDKLAKDFLRKSKQLGDTTAANELKIRFNE